MSVTCVPVYGLMFRMLTRFHTLYFSASSIHCNSIVWRRVILARFPYLLEKRTRRILRNSFLLETLISSEYGLTVSGHVTVLSQWPLDKNTDYVIKYCVLYCTVCYIFQPRPVQPSIQRSSSFPKSFSGWPSCSCSGSSLPDQQVSRRWISNETVLQVAGNWIFSTVVDCYNVKIFMKID